MKKDSETKFDFSRQRAHIPGSDTAAISQACNLLRQAKVKSCDWLSKGSNYVFLATLISKKKEIQAVYKPRQGEVPLWDFPDGTLYKRESAAFVVSQALKWFLVPPTVIRGGPYGIGSMQWLVKTKLGMGYQFPIKDALILKKVALFDYLVNNADRKAGHFLEDQDGRLWLVDHGLTFNTEPKLRTVLWSFAGETIPEELLVNVRVLQSKLKQGKHLRNSLYRLLEESEIKALEARIDAVIEKPKFVYLGSYRSVPWPWY
jgi:hypothetical protein